MNQGVGGPWLALVAGLSAPRAHLCHRLRDVLKNGRRWCKCGLQRLRRQLALRQEGHGNHGRAAAVCGGILLAGHAEGHKLRAARGGMWGADGGYGVRSAVCVENADAHHRRRGARSARDASAGAVAPCRPSRLLPPNYCGRCAWWGARLATCKAHKQQKQETTSLPPSLCPFAAPL